MSLLRTGLTIFILGAMANFAPSVAYAADGMNPACNAPENWQEDMAIERLMEVGWPAWFEACRPGLPPIWPTDRSGPSAADNSGVRPSSINAPSTSSPGTLWDQPVADPLNNVFTVYNNLLNFSGFGDTSNFRQADDFFLDPALLIAPGCRFEITQVRYSEHDNPPGSESPAADYLLEIWNDGGGRPTGVGAADRAAGPFSAATSTFLGNSSFGSPTYELTWNFGPPLVLSPGTYWLSASVDNMGGTSSETTTPAYAVPSGTYGTSQCNTCTGMWTFGAPGGGTDSLDFDIDGSVVCPADNGGPVFPVGGFEVGRLQSANVAEAVVTDRRPMLGALAALVAALMIAGAGGVWVRGRNR
jgi:hypothetical protein